MIDREEMTDVSFELLKLLFFVVTFFLIVNDLEGIVVEEVFFKEKIVESEMAKLAPFYNTLFIFSATTWIDYLSSMKDSIREGYIYNGKYVINPRVCIAGASVGFITTFISLMCVFFKSVTAFVGWGALIYWGSLFFLGLKAYVISGMISQIKNDWSWDSTFFTVWERLLKVLILVAFCLIPFVKKIGAIVNKKSNIHTLLFLLLDNRELVPCFVLFSLLVGVFFNDYVIYKKKSEGIEAGLGVSIPVSDNAGLIEQSFLDIQNETDGKMPYDDYELNWIIGKEKEENVGNKDVSEKKMES